jgi:hypothetical protein
MKPQLNEARARRVLVKLGPIVKAHLDDGPPSQEKVYELLNVLAALVAPVLLGTGDDIDEVRMWFDNAIDTTIADIIEIRKEKDTP